MRNKHVIIAVIATWLLVSFVPSISAARILGKGKS